jgi:hypothetical protein
MLLSFISVLVVGHLVRSQHLPAYLPTCLPTYHPKVKRSAVLATTVLPSIDTVLCCGRRDQKRGLEQLEVQLYLRIRHLPAALLWKGAKLPKSNNIGGLMTLPARISLSSIRPGQEKGSAESARDLMEKPNSRLLPQWGGLSSGPFCCLQLHVPNP